KGVKNGKPNNLSDPKRAIPPWATGGDDPYLSPITNGNSNGYHYHQQPVTTAAANGSRTHHLTNEDVIRPTKPYNSRQLSHQSSAAVSPPPPPPPPPPPTHGFDYEFDITSANCKSIRTNVSDSANYSDEDEEEEIKVIIRPQLPPLKREQLSEARRERILLSEDLFNLRPFGAKTHLNHNHNHNTKSGHCWTPLHDLSTSDDEDDDGINSGNHSDESIQKCDKPLNNNCYDTRFTLKNQLRTLVQNKQFKQTHNHLFPY
ncbi:unnamed protein product, partial [Medioppia subpectinata]